MSHLSGVRNIPWRGFRHAYGDASDIPGRLRALLSEAPQQRRDAARDLHHSLVHQGLDRGPATAHAAGFIVRMLGDARVRDRHRLIELLVYFAVGEPNNAHYFANGYDLDACFGAKGAVEYGWLRIADPSYGPNMRDIFRRVSQGLPIYLELLGARSTRIRRAIPWLLGWLAPDARVIAPALQERLEKEPDALARGSAALGLSLVTHFDAALTGEARRRLHAAFARARRRDERYLIAAALIRQPRPTPPEAVRLLLSAVHQLDSPWRIVGMPDFMFSLVLARSPASRAAVVRAGLRVLQTTKEDWLGADLAAWLADHAVRTRREGRDLERALGAEIVKWTHVPEALERMKKRLSGARQKS